MPWTPSQFNARHLGGNATAAQARQGAAAANSALRACLAKGRSRSSCEGSAVRIGKAAARTGQAQETANFHSARIRNPGLFVNIVQLKAFPNGVRIIGGRLKSDPGGSSNPQAYRFPRATWTVERAKAWLRKEKIKWISFEKATGEAQEMKREGMAAKHLRKKLLSGAR